MMDEEKTNPADEEYRFSDLETSDLYGSTEKNADAAARVKKMRRVLFIIGIVIILFLAYKIFNVFIEAPPSKPQQRPTPAQAQQTALPAIPVQAQPPLPTQRALMPEPTPVAETPALSGATQQLQGDVDDIKSSLRDLQGTLATLNYSLQGLTQQLKQQHSLLENQEKLLKALQPPPKPVVKKTMRMSTKSTVYYVDAMIPGRAWLKTANGDKTITVSEGDKIIGYEGVVVQIDPNAGEVIMSSGQIIRYRENER